MKSRAAVAHQKLPTGRSTESPAFESLPHLLSFAALLLALFIAPAQFSGFWPASYDYLPQSLFSGLTAIAALLLALSPRPVARRSAIGWCLAALLGWMLLAAPGSVYRHDTILEVARVGTCVAWFWIARDLFKEQFIVRTGLALGAVTLGALWVVLPPIFSFLQTRLPPLTGFFANNNLYANFCALAFPCALSFAVALRRLVPTRARATALVGGLVLAMVIAVGLVVSASKGGFMAVLGAGVVWLGLALRARAALAKEFVRARRGLVLGVGLAILLLGGGVVVKTVGPRILKARGSENHSTMFRVYTWRATEKLIAARPLLGWGAGSFPSTVSQTSEVGYTRTAHQSWLQLAAENGVPAVLFLGAACGLGLWAGWRAARTARWNEAAAGAGAVVAFSVHGCVDAGWGASSIVLLLMLALALLDGAAGSETTDSSPAAAPHVTRDASASGNASGNLRPVWLGAVLVLGAAAWLTQHAAGGEDLRLSARDAASRGLVQEALTLADEAVTTDPLGVRMRSNRAQAHESAGTEAEADWAAAARLRPTDAQTWRQWAEYRAERGRDAQQQFDMAVRLAPNDSRVLLARGEWLLKKGDARGWKDLERIASLLDAPYGLYPATPELYVDMDAVRALVRLARRDIAAGDTAKAKVWLNRVAPMIAQEQSIIGQQRIMAKDMQGTGIEIEVPQDLDSLVADLHELQAKL